MHRIGSGLTMICKKICNCCLFCLYHATNSNCRARSKVISFFRSFIPYTLVGSEIKSAHRFMSAGDHFSYYFEPSFLYCSFKVFIMMLSTRGSSFLLSLSLFLKPGFSLLLFSNRYVHSASNEVLRSRLLSGSARQLSRLDVFLNRLPPS